MPWMWIVAGPNGSGKTTFADSGYIQSHLDSAPQHINPDTKAAQLAIEHRDLSSDDVSLLAAQWSDAAVDRCIEEDRTFLVETVLSSDKFKGRVHRARLRGFSIGLTYVVLFSAELSILRVRQRVALGGHNVPPGRIRERWARSVANLRWFAEHADVVEVIDNSEVGTPVLIAEKKADGQWTWHAPGRIQQVDDCLVNL